MLIHSEETDPRRMYRLLIGIINPRPIAWVSTCSVDGVHNLAPFSFFNGVCANPPALLFCPANTRDGTKKDTLINIEDTGEFVVNVVNAQSGPAMSNTSAALPHGHSEFEHAGLTPIPSRFVNPPRLKESPVQIECKLKEIVRVGDGALAGNIVIGLILCIHLDDSVLDPDGLPDPARLDTIARMGGDLYAYSRERFEIPRPRPR